MATTTTIMEFGLTPWELGSWEGEDQHCGSKDWNYESRVTKYQHTCEERVQNNRVEPKACEC